MNPSVSADRSYFASSCLVSAILGSIGFALLAGADRRLIVEIAVFVVLLVSLLIAVSIRSFVDGVRPFKRANMLIVPSFSAIVFIAAIGVSLSRS